MAVTSVTFALSHRKGKTNSFRAARSMCVRVCEGEREMSEREQAVGFLTTQTKQNVCIKIQ